MSTLCEDAEDHQGPDGLITNGNDISSKLHHNVTPRHSHWNGLEGEDFNLENGGPQSKASSHNHGNSFPLSRRGTARVYENNRISGSHTEQHNGDTNQWVNFNAESWKRSLRNSFICFTAIMILGFMSLVAVISWTE